MGSLEFCYLDCGYVIVLLSLFELHAMDEKMFNHFLIGK